MDYSLFPYVLDHATGRIFYVAASGRVWEWHPDNSGGFGALGFWEELINQGIQIGASLFGASQAGAAQEREIGAAFEQLAGNTTQLFNQIQAAGRPITTTDYQAALTAYNQLAAVVQQYPIAYITQKWNDPNYRTAYESRLRQIQSAAGQAVQNTAGAVVTTNAQGQQVVTYPQTVNSTTTTNLLPIGLLVLAGVMLLKR